MAEKKLRFKVRLEGKEGSQVAGLIAPFDVMKTFGTKARVPVRGTINGFPFRSSLMPMGGCHTMAVNKIMHKGARCKAGDVIDVVMERDVGERTLEAPPELKKELAKSKAAQERWEKLSFTRKKEMANCIREAKQEETKQRRLAKVMQILKTGAKWTGRDPHFSQKRREVGHPAQEPITGQSEDVAPPRQCRFPGING